MSGDHAPAVGGPHDGAGAEWKALDALVIAAIVVVVVIGAELLMGYMVRERLSRALRRDLVKAAGSEA